MCKLGEILCGISLTPLNTTFSTLLGSLSSSFIVRSMLECITISTKLCQGIVGSFFLHKEGFCYEVQQCHMILVAKVGRAFRHAMGYCSGGEMVVGGRKRIKSYPLLSSSCPKPVSGWIRQWCMWVLWFKRWQLQHQEKKMALWESFSLPLPKPFSSNHELWPLAAFPMMLEEVAPIWIS